MALSSLTISELPLAGDDSRGLQDLPELGLTHSVTTDSELMTDAMQLAQTLARGPTKAYAAQKMLLRRAVASSLADALETEASIQGAIVRTQDARQAVQAFRSKSHRRLLIKIMRLHTVATFGGNEYISRPEFVVIRRGSIEPNLSTPLYTLEKRCQQPGRVFQQPAICRPASPTVG